MHPGLRFRRTAVSHDGVDQPSFTGGGKGQDGSNVIAGEVRKVAEDSVLGHSAREVLHTSYTVIRVPLTHGFALRTAGFTEIWSRQSMPGLYPGHRKSVARSEELAGVSGGPPGRSLQEA